MLSSNMVETRNNKAQEFAADLEMPFRVFAGRCMLRGLSYETAKDVWQGIGRGRGYNLTTKSIVAKVVRRPVAEVFPDD